MYAARYMYSHVAIRMSIRYEYCHFLKPTSAMSIRWISSVEHNTDGTDFLGRKMSMKQVLNCRLMGGRNLIVYNTVYM